LQFFERIRIRKLLLVSILLSVAIIIGIGATEGLTGREVDTNLVNVFLYSGLLLWFIWKSRKTGNRLTDFTEGFRKGFNWKEVAALIFFHFLITIGFIFIILLIASYISPQALNSVLHDENLITPQTLNSKIYYAISAVLLAPVVEEIAFRGIILNRLRSKWGIGAAVVVSSIVFGILHYKLAIVGALTFGICLALVYLKTQNILVAITIHFINNLLAVAFMFIPSGDASSIETLTIQDARAAGWYIGLPFTIASVIFMIYYFKRNWPKQERKRKALLVIDMQQAFFNIEGKNIHKSEELVNNIETLVGKARETRTPVIYVQHSGTPGSKLQKGMEGWLIHNNLTPLKNEIIVHKRTVDPFSKTSLKKELEFMNLGQIVIAGLQTEYSIDSVCRHAAGLGYRVILASDAHSTFDAVHMDAAHIIEHHNKVLSDCFVRLKTTEDILQEDIL
jgi:uncharacterized protein